MLWRAGITGPFHPKPRRAVHRSLRWLCRRVCQGTAACQGCTGTSREAAQGAETSCWDLLLQSGRHRTVPLQSVTALLRQHSCLWLFLLMLLPTQAAAGPLHCHVCQKSPPWEGPSIASSPMGRYLRAGAALLSSSLAQTTENHHSSMETLTGVCKAEEPTPREQPVSTFSVPGDLILALVCSESSVLQMALSKRDLIRLLLAASFLICSTEQTPGWKSICPQPHGGWLQWQRAAGIAHGQLQPWDLEEAASVRTSVSPSCNAFAIRSAVREVLQEQWLPLAACLAAAPLYPTHLLVP